MKSRIRTRKKSPREQTPDFSTAPAQPMFQSRPFVVQTQKTEPSQQHDLKTALNRAERYGHHLRAPKSAGLQTSTGGNETRAERPVIQKVSNSQESNEVSTEWMKWAATALTVSLAAIGLYLSFYRNRSEGKEKLDEAIKQGKKPNKRKKKSNKGEKATGQAPTGKEQEESGGEGGEAQTDDEAAESLKQMVDAQKSKVGAEKKKEEEKPGPSAKKAPLTEQKAQEQVEKWKQSQLKNMIKEIQNILQGKGDAYGSVQCGQTPGEELMILNMKGDVLKKELADEIKKQFPHKQKVGFGVWKEATFYHTKGTGKGLAGFNLTGHGKGYKGAGDAVFNIHILDR